MIRGFMQNQNVGMTKDLYFEMCEMMGNPPRDSEIPIDMGDFAAIVQVAFSVYTNLQDNWDTMNGGYLGKVRSNFTETLTILGIEPEDFREVFTIVNLIDSVRISVIKENTPKAPEA